MRRATDRHAVRNTTVGLVVVAIGIGLRLWGGFSEWGTTALIFLGGVLVQGHSVVGLVRAWRGNQEPTAIRRRRDSGVDEGVEPTD